MSRERAVQSWRRVAGAARFAVVAVAVGLLGLAMLGAIAIAILGLVTVVGTLLGR